MVKMNDEELTRLAAQELIKDAKKFMDRRNAEFRATQMKQPMKTNKRFLNNTIRNVVSFNKHQVSKRKLDQTKGSNLQSKQRKEEHKIKKYSDTYCNKRATDNDKKPRAK